MKVLHLFSGWKWTGPAEPALNLCIALRQLGVEADYACGSRADDVIDKLRRSSRERGVEPIYALRLSKHQHPVRNFLSSRALAGLLRRERYDLVHSHMDNDERIAIAGCRSTKTPLVRSSYYGLGFRTRADGGTLRDAARLALKPQFLIQPSQAALEYDRRIHGIAESKMRVVPGAVDTERFDPARKLPDVRSSLGIPPEAFVVGIVARMQPHRRFEDFLEAIARLISDHPEAHALFIGRGEYAETIGLKVEELGIGGHVHFPGYTEDEDYVATLAAIDVKVLMMPGSDGTCRAVREALALGKPVVVANEGMLPEVVDDAKTGYVFDGRSSGLFEKLSRLAGDRDLTARLGAAAREKALSAYSLSVQASTVEGIYEGLLRSR